MLSADRSRNKKKEEKIHGAAICTRQFGGWKILSAISENLTGSRGASGEKLSGDRTGTVYDADTERTGIVESTARNHECGYPEFWPPGTPGVCGSGRRSDTGAGRCGKDSGAGACGTGTEEKTGSSWQQSGKTGNRQWDEITVIRADAVRYSPGGTGRDRQSGKRQTAAISQIKGCADHLSGIFRVFEKTIYHGGGSAGSSVWENRKLPAGERQLDRSGRIYRIYPGTE